MSTSIRLALVTVALFATAACGQMVLTQNTDNMTILPANSVSCNAGGLHTDNGYWREYDLSTFATATGMIEITGIRVGIEQATAGAGAMTPGMQPVEVRLYVNPAAFPVGAAAIMPDHTEMVDVADGALIFQTIPINFIDPMTMMPAPFVVDGDNDTLVVEFFTPDGQTPGHMFFIGSNNLGQTSPSYLNAAACGIVDPTDTAGIGFPDMHIIVDVEFSPAGPPPPSCTVTGPMVCTTGAIDLTVDAMNMAMPGDMTITVEYSPAGMGTFLPCTMTGASANPNPTVMAPPGMYDFQWDAAADGVGAMGCEMFDIQVTVIDMVSAATSTCTTTVEGDNSSLCQTVCGDCDDNGAGPDILDALTAAQIAAGLIMPSMTQTGCCDTDNSGAVNVLDALTMAQGAAGLMVTLTCP